MIFEATHNGWNRCAVTGISTAESKTIIPAIRIHSTTPKDFLASISQVKNKTMILADAGDYTFNRFLLTQQTVKFIAGFENLPKNGFDHIIAKLARDKKTGIVIELASIIHPRTRKNALKNYADILSLQRKYQFPLVIASGAKSPSEIRNISETIALCSLFGMTRTEVYTALSTPDTLLNPHRIVEIEYS